MQSPEFLYSQSSLLIVFGLFLGIMLTIEIGFRIGVFVQTNTDEDMKQLTGAIQGSILGLLALLLGFTFSMSMQRFDNRSLAVIEEANAIGTAVLRSQLLIAPYGNQASQLLTKYADVRLQLSKVDLVNIDERKRYAKQVGNLQQALWQIAIDSANVDPRPVTSGSFISALNDMIDTQGKRSALLQMQVPESVLYLLFAVFLTAGGVLGYSSGLGGRRVMAPTAIMALLIVLIVFIIIDLDRPRRGIIQVNQSSLMDLSETDLLHPE